MNPPKPATLINSAFRIGSLRHIAITASPQSSSGVDLACLFSARGRAVRFAQIWSCRLGRPLVVRPMIRAGRPTRYFVSVSVAGCVPFGDDVAGEWPVFGLASLPRVALRASVALL